MTPTDARMPPTGYAVRPETTAAYQQLEAEIVRLTAEVERLRGGLAAFSVDDEGRILYTHSDGETCYVTLDPPCPAVTESLSALADADESEPGAA